MEKISRKWVLRFRAADKKDFLEIKNGLKVVETRAATPKYQAIKKGDTLVIVCGRSRLEKEVKRVRVFRSIGAMTKMVPFRRIMPSVKSVAELRQAYYRYPGYREKLKEFGVVAFEI